MSILAKLLQGHVAVTKMDKVARNAPRDTGEVTQLPQLYVEPQVRNTNHKYLIRK